MTDDQAIEQSSLFQLPSNWIWGKLEDLVLRPKDDIVDGPFGSNLKSSSYVDSGIPIIRLQNIDRNLFILKNMKYVSLEKAQQLNRHNFSKGDIVITKLGAPLGKACIVPENIDRGIIVADVVRLRVPDELVSKKYLVYAINSEIAAAQLKRKTKGTTRPRVNLNHIRKLIVPVAPLNEQRRIVGKLEELFSFLDAGLESLRKVQAQLKRHRQAVLKYAFEGKLTEEWREKHQKNTAFSQDTIRNEQVQPFIENFTIPNTWHWKRLVELADVMDVNHKMPKAAEAGVPLVSPKDFFEPNGIDFQGAKKISEKDYLTMCRKCRPSNGDILFSRYGTIGKVRKVPNDMKFQISYSLSIIRHTQDITVDFLFWFLKSSFSQSQAFYSKKSSAIPDLGLAYIRNFMVPLPSIKEQQEITLHIERLFSLIDNVTLLTANSLAFSQRLGMSILKEAFEGKLIPQDPVDEPADMLLRRIKEQKSDWSKNNSRGLMSYVK